jgi:hypothetical protein
MVKAILILIVILAIWIGVGIFIYNQINPPSHTPPTTSQTTTTTTNNTTTTTTTTTPTSNLSQSEQDYIAKIADHSSRVIVAVTSLSELLADPQINNATWISQATAQSEAIKSLYEEISQVSTPYSLFEIHYNYNYAIGVYKSAAQTIDQVIAEQDTGLLQLAVSYINSGTNLLTTSINMLNNFIAEHS